MGGVEDTEEGGEGGRRERARTLLYVVNTEPFRLLPPQRCLEKRGK